MEKKDQIKLGITGVLIIIFIFALNYFRASIKRGNARRQKAVGADELRAEKDSASGGKIAGRESIYTYLEKQTKDLKLGKDPFFKAPRAPAAESPQVILDLSGILWEPENPKAIINGNIVVEGDMIGAGKIIEIQPDKVIINDGFADFELRVGGI